MMKPDPMPQPVLMNTVALRAVSIALRAGKDLATCASRPVSARAGAAVADRAGGTGRPAKTAVDCASCGPAGVTLAGARGCRKYQAREVLMMAVAAIPPQPNPESIRSCRTPEAVPPAWCWANFAK